MPTSPSTSVRGSVCTGPHLSICVLVGLCACVSVGPCGHGIGTVTTHLADEPDDADLLAFMEATCNNGGT